MYDVVVVGAGPAGCMTAKRTAEAGYKVLLVEKMQVPREKSCSGILITKSIDMVEGEFGKILGDVLCRPTKNKGIIINDEENRVFKFESEGLNVWRNLFDLWLVSGAENAGVEFRQSTAVISCEEMQDHVRVTLQGNEIYHERAKIVVAGDGAASNLKKNLLKTQDSYIFTYQTFCSGTVDLDYNFFHAFMQPQLSQYDAWFNVKDDFLIFGIAVKDFNKIKGYHEKFLSFLASNFNAEIKSFVKREVGIMPCVLPEYRVDLGIGKVLFVGEAANFLNPVGEGISSALASGYAAAEAIKSTYKIGEDVDVQSLLNAYEKNVEPDKQYMIRQWKLLARISPKFSHLG